MMLRVVAGAAAVLSAAGSPASASSWPLAGGDPSRSGFSADGGALPAAHAWTALDGAVRTPVVVSGGGGPGVQRVAYGTADGRVHVRLLSSGGPVGPPEGVPAADAALTEPAAAFGRGLVSAGFADTSTADRLGVLHVVHNDGGGIEILRVDLASGARIGGTDTAVPGTLGCGVAGSPLLTPPAADGSRFLYFTMRGGCPAGAGLVRVPITGDAAAPTARLGTPTYAQASGLSGGAGPSLVVLRSADGIARFHVALARVGGVDFYEAARALGEEPAVIAPDLTADLPPGELPGTVSAPATAEGLVAGARGAGTPPAAALYVAAEADGATHVHRLVPDGAAVAVGATAALPGLPGRGLAVAQTMTPTGPSAGGRVLVGTSDGLALLRAGDLSEVARRPGAGFAEALPVATAHGAFSVRSVPDAPAELLALSLADLSPTVVEGWPADVAPGQPALARGLLVSGGPDRVTAHRLRDAAAPDVSLVRTRTRRGARVRLVARAADEAGLRSLVLRLRGGRRLAATRPEGFTDRARLVARVRLRPGRRRLQAVATDAAGNAARATRRVRVRR